MVPQDGCGPLGKLDKQILLMQEPRKITATLLLSGFSAMLWIWLCWSCLGEWLQNPDYQYGLIVPFLAVYFLLRDGISLTESNPTLSIAVTKCSWFTLFIVAFSCGPIELIRLSPLYWRLLPWVIGVLATIATLASAWLIAGASGLRKVFASCALMLTAIPWPSFLEQATTLRLMTWVTHIVGSVLPYGGIPAQIQGNTLLLPNCMIGVAEACSGIRSLQASLMLAIAAGEMFRIPIARRILLIFLGSLLAFIINILRTFGLSFVGMHGGQPAVDKLHNLSAGASLILLAGGIFYTARLLRKNVPENVVSSSSALTSLKPSLSASIAVIIFGFGGFLLAHAWYAWHGGQNHVDSPMLSYHRNDVSITYTDPNETLLSVLRPTEGKLLLRQFPLPMAAYHFYWNPSYDNASHLYHRPDVCMPGVGWIPEGVPKKLDLIINGQKTEWTAFAYQRGDIHATLLWASWLDRHSTGLNFKEQIHLQHAMTRKLIAHGKRKLSYEIAAVFIPRPLESLTTEDCEQAVSSFFDMP